jgi:hypothetical protein
MLNDEVIGVDGTVRLAAKWNLHTAIGRSTSLYPKHRVYPV